MTFDPDKHHRRSFRLKGYDYSAVGAYFLTICTHQRECLFGKIVEDRMVLNDAGMMVKDLLIRLFETSSEIQLDTFIIMPNHFHGIIQIACRDGISSRSARFPDDPGANMESVPGLIKLSDIVQSFKRHTTIEYIKMVKQNVLPPFNKRIWQRNYFEHIIRSEVELDRIRQYIEHNPANWDTDENNIS